MTKANSVTRAIRANIEAAFQDHGVVEAGACKVSAGETCVVSRTGVSGSDEATESEGQSDRFAGAWLSIDFIWL
jgi:hypothetical protein